MFLKSLNPTEKENFMKLAVAIIKADGIVAEAEMQILSAYADEMQIPVCGLEEQDNVTEVLDAFAIASTPQTKRIVFVELLALAFADGIYADEEQAFVEQVANAFGLDNAFVEQAVNAEDAYIAAYMNLTNLVEKGE